jgi:tripartite ATP-independent transporter DctP family solute receptor
MVRSFFIGAAVAVLICSVAFAWLLRQDRQARAEDDKGGQRFELRLAHGLDQKHPVHEGMVYMAERVAAKSGGTVTIRIFPNGELGPEVETVEQVQRGGLAMSKTSTGPLESFVPTMSVFSLPYLFRDREHFWAVLDGPIGDELLLAGRDKGLVGLCYYDAGARSFYMVDKPIMSPADLVGEKIRVQKSPTAIAMVEALGGSPTPIPWGELYTALQTGTVDGAENNPPSYYSNRHYEVAPHFSLDEHARVPDILLISREKWDALPPRVRQWLREAARESSEYQRKLWAQRSDEALAAVQEAGAKVYRPDPKPFAEAVRPMHADYEGTAVGDLVERIRAFGSGDGQEFAE